MPTKKSFTRLRLYSIFLFIYFFAFLVGCTVETESGPNPTIVDSQELTVHFIDVGQGDATLLEGPDFTILIDAGKHNRNDVVPYLESMGIKEIDLFIGTHPHADHIGQANQVMEAFEIKEVWLSGDTHTSKTFERTIDSILAKDIAYHEPRVGEKYEIGSLRLEVLNPVQLTGDFHEGCISVRAVYEDISFLFTGDAEEQTEAEMVERGYHLQANIYQLGHHGSSTSNTEAFLQAVNPEVAIYSAGKDNSYGHPHLEVMERLEEMQIPVYGTDVHGTILVVTDGKLYELQLEKME